MTRRKVGLIAILVVLILLGAGGFYWYSANGRTPSYRTAAVERGELLSTISSTGTLNAVVTVQVGTQVSGTIQQLLVDFNSPVKKGMLIARIDPSIFDAKVNQAQGDLENSRLGLEPAGRGGQGPSRPREQQGKRGPPGRGPPRCQDQAGLTYSAF